MSRPSLNRVRISRTLDEESAKKLSDLASYSFLTEGEVLDIIISQASKPQIKLALSDLTKTA